MYVVILICAIIAFTSAREDTPEAVVITPKSMTRVLRVNHKCEIENNPPPDSLRRMLKGVYQNKADLNFMSCYLTHSGYVTKDGHFIISKLVGLVKEDHPKKEKLSKMFNECNKLTGEDPVDSLSLLLDCFRENTPVVFTL